MIKCQGSRQSKSVLEIGRLNVKRTDNRQPTTDNRQPTTDNRH
ncbi:MAG: hypothetical protein SF339_13810 [Blastocatellia bacterium]|nr:hypothetical protein [Blastocatellia bacterium]